MISTDRKRNPKKPKRTCLIILLAPFIVSRRLRRQSTRLRRVLHSVPPEDGDKRRRRAADTSPDRAPRFKPVNQHLWSKPMIDLQSLHAQIRHLRDRSTVRIIKLEAVVEAAKRDHVQLTAIETTIVAELSRLHEKQPEV